MLECPSLPPIVEQYQPKCSPLLHQLISVSQIVGSSSDKNHFNSNPKVWWDQTQNINVFTGFGLSWVCEWPYPRAQWKNFFRGIQWVHAPSWASTHFSVRGTWFLHWWHVPYWHKIGVIANIHWKLHFNFIQIEQDFLTVVFMIPVWDCLRKYFWQSVADQPPSFAAIGYKVVQAILKKNIVGQFDAVKIPQLVQRPKIDSVPDGYQW